MNSSLPPKHSAAQVNIFTTMSALAKEVNAYNLSQGLPDFPVDPLLSELLKQAVDQGHNQYAPMAGLLSLREAIARHYNQHYQTNYCTADTVSVTPGATYGIYTAFAAILNKGDEVVFMEPAFDCYVPAIEINGGIPVKVPLDDKKNYEIDWQKMAGAITDKTKAIIINTPHNPTGRIWDNNDWNSLAAIVKDKNIYIISDEVYNTLVFDQQVHFPGFLQESLSEQIISIYSFGKIYHITGWKIGFVIAGPALTRAFRSVHQYLTFSVNTPAQQALANYIDKASIFSRTSPLEANRNLLLNGLKDSGFRACYKAAGTYFQLFDYSAVSRLPDLDFAKWLATEHKVATIPMSAFYKQPPGIRQVRLSFAKTTDVLLKAVEILKKL